MKTFSQLISEMWPGTPEYEKKFGKPATSAGAKHDIEKTKTGLKATRRYSDDDETEAPKVAADGGAPVKRGRGRPPGKYGSYKMKNKVKEGVEMTEEDSITEAETCEDCGEEMTKDHKCEAGMDESLDEAMKGEMHPDAGKVLKHIKPEHHGVYKPFLKKGVYKGDYKDRSAVLSAAEKAGHIKEAASKEDHIVFATGPRAHSMNDVNLVFKDLRTGEIVAHVVGSNGRNASYEIYIGNTKYPTYVASGDPQQTSTHQIRKIVPGKQSTVVSNLDWWKFLEKTIGKIMPEDAAEEAGYVRIKDSGDIVFSKKNAANLKEDAEQVDEVSSPYNDLSGRMGTSTPGYNKTPAGKAREKARKTDFLKGQMRFTKSTGGVAGPKGHLPEEVENLDEISKEMLGSYIKKASHDVATKGAVVRQLSVDSRAAKQSGEHRLARDKDEKANKVFDKSWKRRENMAKAVDRLTKEDVDSLEEMDKSQPSGDRGGESSGNPYAKGGKATMLTTANATRNFLGALNKSMEKARKAKQETDKKIAGHLTKEDVEGVAEGSIDEADFNKQQTVMAHTIGKELAKKGAGDMSKGGPYAIAAAMVRDRPAAAKKAYKTILAKNESEEQVDTVDADVKDSAITESTSVNAYSSFLSRTQK